MITEGKKGKGRNVARGAKGAIAPPPEIFSDTTSLQTKILMLLRKSTNNARRGGLKPLEGIRVFFFDKKN